MRRPAIAVAAMLVATLTGCAGRPGGANLATNPTSTQASALPSTGVTSVPLDPALAARAKRDLGPEMDHGVLLAATAGDESILVVARPAAEAERIHGGRAAAVWIAGGDGPFRRAMDYLSYDFTCRVDDPVCPEVRPGGLGFLALRQQPDGRTFVLIGATGDRSVEVSTAEGTTYRVGAVPHGGVIEVTTSRPYETRTRVTMADGRSYELMVPPHGVVTG